MAAQTIQTGLVQSVAPSQQTGLLERAPDGSAAETQDTFGFYLVDTAASYPWDLVSPMPDGDQCWGTLHTASADAASPLSHLAATHHAAALATGGTPPEDQGE
jgi:hypothetical protein